MNNDETPIFSCGSCESCELQITEKEREEMHYLSIRLDLTPDLDADYTKYKRDLHDIASELKSTTNKIPCIDQKENPVNE